MKDKIAAISAKRGGAMSTKSENEKEIQRDIAEGLKDPADKDAGSKTLPKVTLYAHANVLKAMRLLAVEDGVQAQVILRKALQDYLATRGHHFTDLTTGK